ncbi:MAG: coiled-coil domain-containing protein, partial [Caldanaerobacter sp.]
MKRIISIALASIFIINFLIVKGQEGELGEFYQLKQKEQEVIIEILNLDVEKLKSQKKLEEITAEIEKLNVVIEEKEKEIDRVSKDIEKEKIILNSWFRFLYMSGTNAILSLLLMAKDATDLLHRLIYIDVVTNYYYDKLENLYNLVKHKKEEEKQLAQERELLLQKQEEEKSVIIKLEELKRSKDEVLKEIKAKIENYQRILEIVENTSSSLSSLDFLLSSIPKLPWEKLQPHDVKLSFFSAEATFYDKDVTNLFRSYDEKLRQVEVYFINGGFEIKEENKYDAKGKFEIEDNKIRFVFDSIKVQGIMIEGNLLQKMVEGYDTTLSFNVPLEGWKLNHISS